MTDEEDSLEASVTEEVMVLNAEDEGDCDQSDPPSSEDQVTESITKGEQAPSVKLMNTTEDSITVSVRGSVQEDHAVMLSSLAAFEVKDVRRESDGVLFIVSIPNEARNGAVQELAEEIKTVLEEACRVEACRREIRASSNMEPITRGDDEGQNNTATIEVSKLEGDSLAESAMARASLSARIRAREARKPQAGSQQDSSGALSVARSPSRSEGMANNAREGLGRSGQDLQQIQEQFGEVVTGTSSGYTGNGTALVQGELAHNLGTEKGLCIEVQSEVPQRPRRGDTTPGAFYASGLAFGAPPEWSNRSSVGQPPCREAASLTRTPLSGNIEVSEVGSVVKAFKVDESATEDHVRRRILKEAVEADVIDQVAVKKRRRHRRLLFMGIVLVLVAIAIGLGVALSTKPDKVLVTESPSMAPSTSPTEAPRPTLEKVRSRGAVRCGTFDDLPGLYALNEERNQYEGFNVDLVRLPSAYPLPYFLFSFY